MIQVVGIGPGRREGRTIAADDALRRAEVIVGYTTYVELVRDEFAEKRFVTTGMRGEKERCVQALLLSREGRRVALICSGDAQVYGMASLLLGMAEEGDEIEVVPGVTAALSGGLGSVWEKYTSIDEVMEQNEQLEAENAELRQQMVDYDRIKAENEAYKALARIQDSNTEASYISAFVIGRDPLDEFGGFTLDCGTVNGAAVNDAVISDKGYLIGMVVEADTTSCKVMTILHPSFSAAGVVSRTRENGIINGSTDYAGDGLCVLTNLERATETKMGDQVITTGLGGVFPPDLLVGTVQKVEPEVSGKSSIAVVRPGADPRTVKHVFVITDY